MLENDGLLRRVVHSAERRALCAPPLLPATTAVSQEAPRRIPECLMPDRPPNLGWAPRAALFAALLPLLAALRSGAQPVRAALPGPGDPGRCGGFRHLPAAAARRVAATSRTSCCTPGSSASRAAAGRATRRTSSPSRSNVGVELNRGPAMQGREAEVPVFVAVTDGETILDKRTYRDARRVPVQRRSRHADARRGESRAAGDPEQVGRGLHHPRRVPAHAGPDGAEPPPQA